MSNKPKWESGNNLYRETEATVKRQCACGKWFHRKPQAQKQKWCASCVKRRRREQWAAKRARNKQFAATMAGKPVYRGGSARKAAEVEAERRALEAYTKRRQSCPLIGEMVVDLMRREA